MLYVVSRYVKSLTLYLQFQVLHTTAFSLATLTGTSVSTSCQTDHLARMRQTSVLVVYGRLPLLPVTYVEDRLCA